MKILNISFIEAYFTMYYKIKVPHNFQKLKNSSSQNSLKFCDELFFNFFLKQGSIFRYFEQRDGCTF